MLDIKTIRENADRFDAEFARRNIKPIAVKLIEIDKRRRKYQTEAQELQTQRNEISRIIGQKKVLGEDSSLLMEQVSDFKKEQMLAEENAKLAKKELDLMLNGLPNIPAADVPDGQDETDNVELRKWGQPKEFSFDDMYFWDWTEEKAFGGTDSYFSTSRARTNEVRLDVTSQMTDKWRSRVGMDWKIHKLNNYDIKDPWLDGSAVRQRFAEYWDDVGIDGVAYADDVDDVCQRCRQCQQCPQ